MMYAKNTQMLHQKSSRWGPWEWQDRREDEPNQREIVEGNILSTKRKRAESPKMLAFKRTPRRRASMAKNRLLVPATPTSSHVEEDSNATSNAKDSFAGVEDISRSGHYVSTSESRWPGTAVEADIRTEMSDATLQRSESSSKKFAVASDQIGNAADEIDENEHHLEEIGKNTIVGPSGAQSLVSSRERQNDSSGLRDEENRPNTERLTLLDMFEAPLSFGNNLDSTPLSRDWHNLASSKFESQRERSKSEEGFENGNYSISYIQSPPVYNSPYGPSQHSPEFTHEAACASSNGISELATLITTGQNQNQHIPTSKRPPRTPWQTIRASQASEECITSAWETLKLSQLRELPPRAAKRNRENDNSIPITPQSMPCTPPQAVSFDGQSSPLSSPPMSEISFHVESPPEHPPEQIASQHADLKMPDNDEVARYPMKNQAKKSPTPKRGRKKAPQRITEITVAEGDIRSQPLPGPQLLQMVEEAKSRGELPKIYDSSAVRFVDEKWMVPQICKCCQHDSRPMCNRQSPCSSCVNNNRTCETDGFMTKLRYTRSKNAAKISHNGVPRATNVTIEQPLAHAHVGQNIDGSWFCGPQVPPGESISRPEIKQRRNKRRSIGRVTQIGSVPAETGADQEETTGSENEHPKPYKSRRKKRKGEDQQENGRCSIERVTKIGSVHAVIGADQEETTESENELPKPRKSRGKKRKANDDVFSPGPEPNDDEKPTKKPKGVAKGKYRFNQQLDKPEPHGKPQVWADKRQGLCETLWYYNAYQSGAYTSLGIVYGFLIDSEISPRDRFDEEIIISAVGGGRSMDENGRSARTKDQVKSTTAQAFMRNKERKVPVVVIAGQGNRISPSKLPHYYNVLDFFHVTDVWAEKCDGKMAWKVRLEKINLAGKSWWAAKDSSALTQDSSKSNEKLGSEICLECSQASKSIYNAGWTCLNTECNAFFRFENECDEASLDYNESFLRGRTTFSGEAPGLLVPSLITEKDMASMDAFGIEKIFTRGIVCPQCGCCSRRISWDHWFCENPGCDFTYRLKKRLVPIKQVIERSIYQSEEKSPDFWGGGIRPAKLIKGAYDVNQYSIPGESGEIIGFVRHFKSNGIINQQKDGPNDLFRQMQRGDFNFERKPVRQPGSPGEVLTSHFARNWGAPYKFVASHLSTSFHEAPDVILKALKRLTWAGEQAVTDNLEPFHPFNECLSIGYYEDTQISASILSTIFGIPADWAKYHDDGEKELGPTVATLSLGASAYMSFRPKTKCNIGKVVGPGNGKGTKPPVMRITLEHGDLLIMHGSKIQQIYEHMVKPIGNIRFALTCRYVRPEMMVDEKESQEAVLKGSLPAGSDKWNYDGDVNAAPVVSATTEVDTLVNSIAAKIKTGDLTVPQAEEITKRLASILTPPSSEPERAIEPSDDLPMPDYE